MKKIILTKPHISEKSTVIAEDGFYVFKVGKDTNKAEIKEAVEKMYKVNIVSVRVISVPSKKRRVGRIEGIRSGYKKAIVKVKQGERIDITSSK